MGPDGPGWPPGPSGPLGGLGGCDTYADDILTTLFFHLNSFHLRFNDIFSRNLTKSAFFFCIFHPNSVFGCLGQSRRRLSTESKKQSKVIKQSCLFLPFFAILAIFWVIKTLNYT